GTNVEVHITVEEAKVSQVQPGQSVQLTVPAYPNVVFPASVATIAPAGDPRAHTFDVKIVPTQPDTRLLPGMYAQVQVTTAQNPSAVLIPNEAIVRGTDGSTSVFVADQGKAVSTPVQLGQQTQTQTEVISGLQPGEQVIVTGLNTIRDGSP